MTSLRRQSLTLALLISLLAHLILVVAPGWTSPTPGDELSQESSPQLEAQLAPARGVAAASPQPARAPRPPAPRRSARPAATIPAEAGEPAADSPSVPLTAPQVEPEAAAIPVLPTEEPPSPPEAPVQLEIALPRRGSIRFVVSRGAQGFVIGQSLHRWSHDEKRYALTSVTETTGIAALFRPVKVTHSSEGEIGAEGLRPGKFSTEKNGVAGEAASFNWTAMTVELSAGNPHEVALKAGAQDMLSMFYQLSAVFPRMPRELNEVMVATGRKFERYAFEVLREEVLSTKQGEWRALHLHAAAGVEAIDLWSGLDLRGLPLRIRYTDRQGESYDQVAEEIDFEGMQGAAGGR